LVERSAWFRALIILGVIALGLYLIGQLWQIVVHFGDIIILFFLAWLLAFALLPIVRFLEEHLPIGRAGAAAAVYAVLLVCLATVVVLVIPLLIAQTAQLAAQLPTLAASIPGRMDQLQQIFDQHKIPVDAGSLVGPSLSQQAGQFGRDLVENSVAIASEVANDVFRFTLVLILSFYFVLDGDRFLARLLAAVPDRFADDANLFVVGIDRSFGGFLRGTAVQMLILALGTAAIMTVAGLRYVLLASLFAGVVMVVPFIGPFLALALPLLIAVFGNLPTTQLVLILVALMLLQFLVMNVIAPAVMSESVGLHPLLVFLGLLVGMKQAGLAGAVFGVPVAAVMFGAGRILLRRWSVVDGHAWEEPARAPRLPGLPRVDVGVIRVDRLGIHLSGIITRLFPHQSG
jgi:predicted PurR-regulated permease PerM